MRMSRYGIERVTKMWRKVLQMLVVVTLRVKFRLDLGAEAAKAEPKNICSSGNSTESKLQCENVSANRSERKN